MNTRKFINQCLEVLSMKKLLILLLLSASLPTSAGFDDFTAELNLYFNSFCYKSPNVQIRNGRLYLPNQQEPITSENLCVYENGQYAVKGNVLNGVKDGEWSKWDVNGQLEYKNNWKNGQPEGYFHRYFMNGNLRSVNNY